MLLGNLIKSVRKDFKKIPVKGISFDSRKVKKNYIFFAVKGNKTSGLRYVKEATQKGAVAIISNKKIKYINKKTPLILVKNVRETLSEACSKLYKNKIKNIIAVTGTNGKSSVADFFYQILKFNSYSVASIGTLGIISKNYNRKTSLTTMDSLSLHKTLNILSRKKIKNIILEASSHGLSQKRLNNINIKTGIFTNLSHDHLDYHKDMKSYFSSKLYLFTNLLNKKSKIITDENNKEFSVIKKIANKKKIKLSTIGLHSGNIKIKHIRNKKNKQVIQIILDSKKHELKIPLIGFFQIKNLFMAALAAINCGVKKNKIFNIFHKIKPVNGRLECLASFKNNSNIILDFAHTPEALEQSLIALKEHFKKKIIIVFGCGGERDKQKRLIMGKIAYKYCKKVFITDDNPRNENPTKIRKEIMKGCKKKAISIGSRSKAIKQAINELKSNEVLLIAGKGHEKTQDYGKRILNFSDKKIVKKIIHKKKEIINKELKNSIKNLSFRGVSINSKNIKKNNLFFAIKGKKMDGHIFVKEAINKGAIKSVVSKKIKKVDSKKIIKVKDTLSSLNNLAKDIRDNSHANIIGITGSVGKTTLKDLVSFALKNYGKVHYSRKSYNNKFGVPLSVSNLRNNTEYGVFEIGMDKKGEIDSLSKIVKPDTAIITNISSAHFKNFNTLKDIAKAKSEIIQNITKDGNIVLNKDCKFFKFLSNKAKSKKINITSFSLKNKSDIFLLNIKKIKNQFRLKISVKNEIFNFNVKYITDSFINNILACISILNVLNLDLKNKEKIFINFKIPEGRGDVKIINKFDKKFQFIDESYNANPLSMISAIKNLNYNKNNRKLMLLGDMLELGKRSKKFHRELSKTINRTSIDKVFVYGNHIKETFKYLSTFKKGKIFKNLDEAYHHFSKILDNNDILMIKGSNATGLNKFSKNIKKGTINAV